MHEIRIKENGNPILLFKAEQNQAMKKGQIEHVPCISPPERGSFIQLWLARGYSN